MEIFLDNLSYNPNPNPKVETPHGCSKEMVDSL